MWPVKVSVVVAVYNPGANMDDLVRSVLAQSLPGDEYEAIFVDDSSTDGTAERLDALAEQHPVISVIHNSPNSGWPGRPRNLGLDAARGTYVYFVDNDDWLEPEALERLYDYAEDNESDIVWGRIVGNNRRVPRDAFRTNVPDARLGEHPLLSLLTPHKLFRTSFLRAHDIRFPEGRRRLEDHVFVMRAYFAASKISILADYPCYHWVSRGTNASFQRLDPAGYFGNVREVLDIVEANTEPGPFRDRMLAHWYGGKSLAWLEGTAMTRYPDDYRRELFDTVRTLAHDRFAPQVDRYLVPRRRLASNLLRDGDLDGLLQWAVWCSGVRVDARVTGMSWHADRLRVGLSAALVDSADRTLAIRRSGEHEYLELPADLGIADLASHVVDVPASVGQARAAVFLRDRASWIVEFGSAQDVRGPRFGPDGRAELRATLDAVIDPAAVGVGAVLDVVVRFVAAGFTPEARVQLPDPAVAAATARTFGDRRFEGYGTEGYGNLSFRWVKPTPARGWRRYARRLRPS